MGEVNSSQFGVSIRRSKGILYLPVGLIFQSKGLKQITGKTTSVKTQTKSDLD